MLSCHVIKINLKCCVTLLHSWKCWKHRLISKRNKYVIIFIPKWGRTNLKLCSQTHQRISFINNSSHLLKSNDKVRYFRFSNGIKSINSLLLNSVSIQKVHPARHITLVTIHKGFQWWMDAFKRYRRKFIRYYAISNRVNLIEIHSVNINQNERQNECFHSNANHKALTAVIKIPSNNSIGICHFEKKKTFLHKRKSIKCIYCSTFNSFKTRKNHAWMQHWGLGPNDCSTLAEIEPILICFNTLFIYTQSTDPERGESYYYLLFHVV